MKSILTDTMNRVSLSSNRKIKLVLFSSVFVNRGAERIILWLEKHLSKHEYDIQIVSLRNLAPFANRLGGKEGPEVHVLGMRHAFDVTALLRLFRFLRSFKPDILHIHSFRAAVVGRPIGRLAGVPVIIYSVHNRWGGKAHYALDRWTTRFGDVTIPFSLAVKNFLTDEEKLDPDKVKEPVYIGIDIDKFRVDDKATLGETRETLGIRNGNEVIGFVGALSKQKGLTYLIDAIGNLHHEFPGLRCLLIGEGDQAEYLKAKVNNLGLQNHVFFLGQRYDIPVLLNLMDVFVLPSLWEGLPQVVLEAMAARCPVLATSVDGTPEIITHGVDGWLMPPCDSIALKDFLKNLLNNTELRLHLAENGYENVCRRFSVARMVSDFDNIYKQYLYAKQ